MTRSRSGSTYVEVILAIIILSAVVVPAARAGARLAATLFDALRRSTARCACINYAEHARQALDRIDAPFWMPRVIETNGRVLSVVAGDAACTLSLDAGQGANRLPDDLLFAEERADELTVVTLSSRRADILIELVRFWSDP